MIFCSPFHSGMLHLTDCLSVFHKGPTSMCSAGLDQILVSKGQVRALGTTSPSFYCVIKKESLKLSASNF